VAYTVLARKYRSRTFDEVIGQKPIATTLVNAIKAGRIAHGYLFTGTRGVGKTSMARILAKALNCLKADEPTPTPCCECEACLAIGEGQDIDVIEIDAASNTGVDNIRDLRSNTAYRPARSRYKVYIIDEVHMLSTGAFNALLKTLEEPPGHIKFILATTEVQKVPATIQSRCQRFNFRNISPDEIAERLKEIAKAEGAKADEEVVRRVARLAAGSMRDALSVLDQLLSVSPKKISVDVLNEVLPPSQDEQVLRLFERASGGDAAGVLEQADAILSAGRAPDVFCNDAIEIARALMLIRACGADAGIVEFPAGDRDEYVQLSEKFELSQYVQMVGLLEELRRNVRFSSAGRALVDAALVRLAKMNEWAPIEQLLTGGAARDDNGAAVEKKKHPSPASGPKSGVGAVEAASAARSLPRQAVDPRSAERSPVRDTGPAGYAAAQVAGQSRERMGAEARGSATQSPDRGAWAATASWTPAPQQPQMFRAPTRVEPEPEKAPPDDVAYALPEARRETGGAEAITDNNAAGLREAPATPGPRVVRRPASAEAQERIRSDPTVRRALELFDGVIVNMEQEAPEAADDMNDSGSSETSRDETE
jgi:DNA polymerase-3 subunit gamma/tau